MSQLSPQAMAEALRKWIRKNTDTSGFRGIDSVAFDAILAVLTRCEGLLLTDAEYKSIDGWHAGRGNPGPMRGDFIWFKYRRGHEHATAIIGSGLLSIFSQGGKGWSLQGLSLHSQAW